MYIFACVVISLTCLPNGVQIILLSHLHKSRYFDIMPSHGCVEVHYHKTLTCEDAHAKEDNLRKNPIRLKIYFFSTMKFAQIDNKR